MSYKFFQKRKQNTTAATPARTRAHVYTCKQWKFLTLLGLDPVILLISATVSPTK